MSEHETPYLDPEDESIPLDDLPPADDDELPVGGLMLFSKQGGKGLKMKKGRRGAGRQAAAGNAIKKIREERERAEAQPAAKLIIEALWLKDKKGKVRRTTSANEGDDVFLEATVNAGEVPDGTGVRFLISERLATGQPAPVDEVRGEVVDGKARAPWTIKLMEREDRREGHYALEAMLSFKVVVKNEEAPSPLLQVKSFIGVTVYDTDGEPIEAEWEVTLPLGIKRRVNTDKEGRFELKVPPGQGIVKLERIEDLAKNN